MKALEFNQNVKSVTMVRENIENDQLIGLFDSLKTNKSIQNLELNCVNLDCNVLMSLGEMLTFNKTLKNLSLKDNKLFTDDTTSKFFF